MSEQRSEAAPEVEEDDLRSDFPRIRSEKAGPSFGPFVEALRRVQDLAVSIKAPDDVIDQALLQAEELTKLLAPYAAAEGVSTAGRAIELPGRGSLLLLPWTIDLFGPDGVRSRGEFSRYHVGGNSAVHGGVLPLLFDDLCGMITFAAGRAISRTGYLHVNYRKVTPINKPLLVEGRVDRVDGRKTFITCELRDESGAVLADCEALMIKLLPGQP
ncbi:PaaI family thioesterase [Antrihabitans sp. YC2-6]|uniref:PaaI family thioesterase n=1 Tax=Antrihabitans sp. YC2-6 TaxID=2799498 RepID=UPI0018F7C427|nr:PaaI family thioesterase [Antrihabitans sp. YC2-6]MBJ8347920.1 PaaI family thioesterase [Antrihabitans sp. YC2-6]